MTLIVWRCSACNLAIAITDGMEYGKIYGKGISEVGTLPARVACPWCHKENERSPAACVEVDNPKKEPG